MSVPQNPKIYHIVHADRLASIVNDDGLLCDAIIADRAGPGTTIGMGHIKKRRLHSPLTSRPGLCVGQCVPFYFCPRSIMLYLISCGNHPDLTYRGGQDPIVHLEADLHKTIAWAEANGRRWAFTLSNAGSAFFEDRCNINQLGEINWDAVNASAWRNCKDGKQAEFLIENSFPWHLVERIGLRTDRTNRQVVDALCSASHRPVIEIRRDWYY